MGYFVLLLGGLLVVLVAFVAASGQAFLADEVLAVRLNQRRGAL